MNEITTEQKNVIIACFEGRKFYGKYTIDNYGSGTHMEYPEMKYHSDWSWLMAVWRKLREAILEHFGEYPSEYCAISDAWEQYCFIVDIEGAYDILYKALQWYQKQKEQQP